MNKVFTVLFLVVLAITTIFTVCADPTTEVCVAKYASDGSLLNETTVSYQWMETNLPIYGDGIFHYYHQGPVFEGDKWDINETSNFKDKGAVMGSNVKDLCDLAGGMSPGDEVMILSEDGYHLEFDYQNVYHPHPRQGPLIICWYCGEGIEGFGEVQGVGYPPDYAVGMRLVFFADNSSNSEGKHVFGNWDMYQCLPEKCHHFYDLYPSTNGFSAKWVDEIRIYEDGYSGQEGIPVKSLLDSEKSSTSGQRSDKTPGFEPVMVFVSLALMSYVLRKKDHGQQK